MAKNDELAFQHIQQEQRIALDANEGAAEHYGQQNPASDRSSGVKTAARFARE